MLPAANIMDTHCIKLLIIGVKLLMDHWSILHTLHIYDTHSNIYLIKITSANCGKRTSRLGKHLIGCDTMILLVPAAAGH